MPKTDRKGKAKKSELPRTLKKSGKKAQQTYAKAHDSAADQYGDGRRANQTAFAALKRTHEKVGDRWEKKAKKGPSDSRAAGGRRSGGKTEGGVDANASKEHLRTLAKRLDIRGRSTMTKSELVDALKKASAKGTKPAK